MSRRADNVKASNRQNTTNSKHTSKKVHFNEDSERMKGIQDMFKLFDKDGDGHISAGEIKSLLVAIGREPSEEQIKKFMNEVDKDGNGEVDLKEFLKFMEQEEKVPRSKQEEIVEAFKVFDLDGNGFVTFDEFKSILMKFGGQFTQKEVREIYNLADADGDGKLTYAEFVELWQYQ